MADMQRWQLNRNNIESWLEEDEDGDWVKQSEVTAAIFDALGVVCFDEPNTIDMALQCLREKLVLRDAWEAQAVLRVKSLMDQLAGWKSQAAILESEKKRIIEIGDRIIAALKRPVAETDSFHFERELVMETLIGTENLRNNVQRHLSTMTSGEQWSLYRAIAKLAFASRSQEAQKGATE
jgi:hypothetical protein